MSAAERSTRRHTRWTASVAILGLLALVLIHRFGLPLFDGIEGALLDARFKIRGVLPAPHDVVIVAVDERSLAEIGRWPLPRAKIAAAIDRLQKMGAHSIGLDLLLSEPESSGDGNALSAGDLALRDSLRVQGRCVLAMAALYEPSADTGQEQPGDLSSLGYRVVSRPAGGGFAPPRATASLLPVALFRDIAVMGHVNLAADPAGERHSFQPAVAIGDTLIPAFSVQLARLQLGLEPDEMALSLAGWLQLGDRRIPLDNGLNAPIDYYGPAGSITTFSLADLMTDKVPSDAIAGRAILLGGTALGLGDRFDTPFARELPGVEVLATVTANLLDGPLLIRTGAMRAWEFAAILILGGLAWVASSRHNPTMALMATVGVMLIWPILVSLAFMQWNLWLNMTVPTFAAIMTSAIVLLGRVGKELRLRREAERQRGNLARYVPPSLADQMAAEEKPGFYEREQPAAILFIDLAGFTALSERRPPGETAEFLKDFHGRLERVVMVHGGVIEQFAGDGAMVIFGLPHPAPEDPVSALACARALVTSLMRWQPALKPRVGLHFGSVAMARLGGAAQSQLAAAGDIVNVASRLEAFAKEKGVAVAVSDAVMRAAIDAKRPDLQDGFRMLADQTIRGREGRLTVWVLSMESLTGIGDP
jgi:adenylate cyclase